MPEQLPGWASVLIAVLVSLGGRELLAAIYHSYATRRRASAEASGLELSNTSDALRGIQQATKVAEDLMLKTQAQLELISKLREEQIEDKRKIDHRDGIIEYQRDEIKSLHNEVASLRDGERLSRSRIVDLEKRVNELETTNSELAGLKKKIAELLPENLQMKAILEKLRMEGKWEGDENVLTVHISEKATFGRDDE